MAPMFTGVVVAVACTLCCAALHHGLEKPEALDRSARILYSGHSGHSSHTGDHTGHTDTHHTTHHVHHHCTAENHHNECGTCLDHCYCRSYTGHCSCHCSHHNQHSSHTQTPTQTQTVSPWEDWQVWDTCSTTCEVGHQSRFRFCKAGMTCDDHNTELRSCDTGVVCPAITQAPTTAAAPVVKTIPPVVTAHPTVSMATIAVCDKLCTVSAVAQANNSASHADAIGCSSGLKVSADALPLHCCGLTGHSTWTRGPKVMDNCPGASDYRPVAMFDAAGRYIAETAGVFAGCLPTGTGFQMTRQLCGSAPEVIHAETGTIFDPHVFYFISA